MKKLTWATNGLACLMIVIAALGALCGAVVKTATNEFFYSGMSRMAVSEFLGVQDAPDSSSQITAYIGMDDAQQDAFAAEMTAFMKGETDAQSDVLNEKERSHMLDVRALVLLAQTISQGCTTLAAALAVVIAWTGAQEKRRGLPAGALLGVSVIALCAVGVCALFSVQGFEALFVRFHELLFTNDLWLMNPQTDILIRMMPQLLFERAGKEVVRLALIHFIVTVMLLMMIYMIVGGMIRRQLTEKK